MTETSPPAPAAARLTCPSCGAEVTDAERFCEACGAPLSPTTEAVTVVETGAESPVELSRPVGATAVTATPEPAAAPPCTSCGGVVGEDGYCTTCGTLARSPRDHYVEQPAAWVAAVCDRGVRHHRNEDATAVAADPEPGSRAVLVVCDGVSTSTDSDVAALAGARSARDVLVAARATGLGVTASRAAALAQSFGVASAQANEAVIANTAADSDNAASCTFAAAVLEGELVVFGTVGDSRVYWLPDAGAGDPLQLSVDDSMAQVRIEMGVDRVEAENGPQAHAITKWLGRDSTDVVPRTGSLTLQAPGWLMVCSDGLWNYCSDAGELQALVAATQATTGPDPLPLAAALVDWANAQGGRDNISVALARHA
ncbi:Serine/threonine protein phosphatase PrpC [Friedmanniella luteola]|uniref:Serine/threonine protein phosphatase PrpC n=1 Tax=Friedmanniella luteola TaxID=546871 RepID=A0A1H1VQ62_9ACTN|nr:zinc ribbon domain-containing protein [Friedmanniella luteola]SDS87074.1 Serine/threonine protein phosphatase PrpC [Friedmanniella luteola]